MVKKRGKLAQVSVEYLIIIAFVTFVVMAILFTAYIYIDTIRDKIRDTQIGNYADKIIRNSENVFYSGEPAKATFSAYLPQGVQSVVVDSTTDEIIITFSSSSGINIRSFGCKVPIEGTLASSEGTHTIILQAQEDKVLIS